LAERLSQLLGFPHVELDALNWDPNWCQVEPEVFRKRVEESLPRDGWVVDGNYTRVMDIVWSQADTVVWLDYSLHLVMWRLTCRTMERLISRRKLWNDNVESWRSQFLSKDSVFLWSLQTHGKKRREYTELMKNPPYKQLEFVRLSSPSAADQWLASLKTVPR
jgi:adenylate kinase family enzyme